MPRTKGSKNSVRVVVVEVIVCLNCGRKQNYAGDDHKFCEKCGKPIRPEINEKGSATP